jgi:PAS domain-containing protein
MPRKPKIPDAPAELRDPAGLETSKRKSKSAVLKNEVDTLKLLHELQVYRVELEVQNSELRIARDEAESLREVYTDLYDFAPLGYFTLIPDGRIQMANLTGAALLGIDRVLLLGQAFSMLISQGHRTDFHQALKRIFEGEVDVTIDSELSVNGQPLKVVTFKFKRTRNGRELTSLHAGESKMLLFYQSYVTAVCLKLPTTAFYFSIQKHVKSPMPIRL